MYYAKKGYLAALLCCALISWGCPLSSQQQDSDNVPPEPDICTQINVAWRQIEPLPYLWGGDAPGDGGLDCSGAVYHVQKQIGRPVPRTTSARYYMLAAGSPTHWSEAGCGDWVWWTLQPTRPRGHIGMHSVQPAAWQSGSSTGPTEIALWVNGFWDRHFEASKKP